jgi:hypothetical protein
LRRKRATLNVWHPKTLNKYLKSRKRIINRVREQILLDSQVLSIEIE